MVALVLIFFGICVMAFIGFILQMKRQVKQQEIFDEIEHINTVMDKSANRPKSLAEARERFSKSLEGIWDDGRGWGWSPCETSYAFFADGRGVRSCGSEVSTFNWRVVGDGQVEFQFLPLTDPDDGQIYYAGFYEDSEWHLERISVFEETGEAGGRTIFGIRGFPGVQALDFRRVLHPSETFESVCTN